jgi:hypothetical protein
MAGVLGNSYSQDLKKIFEKETLTIEELDELVEKFVEGVKNNNFVELGFPKSKQQRTRSQESWQENSKKKVKSPSMVITLEFKPK